MILAAIKDFFRIFGQWLFIWVLDVLFGLVSGLLAVLGIADVPVPYWGLALFVGLALAPMYAYYVTWKDRDRLKEKLAYREWMMQSLSKLASIRAEGVVLRNQGMNAMSEVGLKDWFSAVERWHGDLQKAANELGEHEGSLLQTLNLFVRMYAPRVTRADQKQALDELNATLERLTEMILAFRQILWHAHAIGQFTARPSST